MIGPSRSGKSTFTIALYQWLEDLTTFHTKTVAYETLDLWDNSGPWLLDESGAEPRRRNPSNIEEAKEEYRDRFADLDASINLADAPGEIDGIFRDLVNPADEFVLIISEEKSDSKTDWDDEADNLGIRILCEFISYHAEADTSTDISTVEAYFDLDEMEGQVKNLSNEAFNQDGLESLGGPTNRAIRLFARHLVRI